MTRVLVGAGLLVWAGATLLLSQWRRFARPSLSDRLRPFHPGGAESQVAAAGSIGSIRDVLMPLARDLGDRVASVFGVQEKCERRLQRIHSELSASRFRSRQMVMCAAALVVGAAAATAGQVPAALAVLLVAGGPTLVFLVVEQRLVLASQRWQRTTEEELPVVCEQLAMLVNAGYSLGAALGRLARRGQGCVARDLDGVVNRIRQGLSESEALQEWAERSGSGAVQRLVGVLTVHSSAADLGRMVTAEARQARRDLHRRTVEQMERRDQQVWVPVTVATLVPGAILLAVPFLAALRLFANA
ncbi:MAG TPA: type II secretion system F family protein [Acidimicrobiales bacterium]|nr:type II secretion system F family protein [Acidimicrobiales bacterium]